MPDAKDAEDDLDDLDDYTVTIDGIEHTMRLNEDDAKAYGENAKKTGKASPPEAGKAAGAQSKVTTPPNKSGKA